MTIPLLLENEMSESGLHEERRQFVVRINELEALIAALQLENARLRAVLPLLRTRMESFLQSMDNIIKGIH